jgi:serine/threonine protein kinase
MPASGWARMLEGRVLAGRYALERMVGEGGMGAVFAATQLAVQRRVAVKVLLPHVANDASVVERFRREATLAARVARRGVPQVIDFDHDEVVGPFVAMEYLTGESLADRLDRRGRLAPRVAASLAADILATLEAVHATGVVHRDLKPANVFLAKEGEGVPVVKILDFGIARVLAPHGDMTQDGAVLGTPRYMAPEQAAGEKVDGRADVYAVGAIVYACLGSKPYGEVTGDDVLRAVKSRPPVSLATLNADVPAAIVAVVERAMARTPGDRFQTPAAMRAAIVAAIEGLPESPPASAPPASRTLDTGESYARTTTSEPAGAVASRPSSAPTTESAPHAPDEPGEPSASPMPLARAVDARDERGARRAPGWMVPVVAAVGGLLGIAGFAIALTMKLAPPAPSASPPAPTPGLIPAPATDLAPELRRELDAARAAWRGGDPRARSLLQAVVHDVERSGAKPLSGGAHAAAEALFLMADLDERAVVGPPAREPKTFQDFGSMTVGDLQTKLNVATNGYLSIGNWGDMGLVVCGLVRSGRLYEKALALGRAERDRELAALKNPRVAALYYGDRASLERDWASTLGAYRQNAGRYYEAGLSNAHYATGPFTDPTDGSDCREAALTRQDALSKEGEGSP